MSNVIKPKHGTRAPLTTDLQEFELGYYNGSLYIRENDAIKKISGDGGTGGEVYIDQEEFDAMLDEIFK